MKQVLNKVKDGLFSRIHGNNLIYNACWEDPRCDHKILDINVSSKVVVITSAGCNALDYALKAPQGVYCVDVNPRQNATLELKIALAKYTDYDTLFAFFGKGFHPQAAEVITSLKPHLSDFAYRFWQEKIKYFSNPQRSFYYYGTSGVFAWLFRQYLISQKIHDKAVAMIEATTIEEQAKLYAEIEPVIFSGFIKWMMNRHITMSMLGVPRPQRQLLIDGYEGGITGFLRDAFHHVFAEMPLNDNYFWRAYLTGSYTENCCPEYLKRDNFALLQSVADKVHLNTCTLADFLRENPDKYSDFVLLDHQDWLAAHNEEALKEEWRLIAENSTPDAKTIMRSAALQIDFLPTESTDYFAFTNQIELHRECRVGTYCSTYTGAKK
ncbi:DUF3419 family protein [bacterium]|nr:DUF3419 family protein [bacterium]